MSEQATKDGRDASCLKLVKRAHEFAQRRDFSGASALLKESLAIDFSMPMAHNNLGWALQMLGEPEQAKSAYRMAIELNSTFDLPRRNLAELEYLCGQRASAIDGYQELVRLYSESRTIWSEALDLALKCRAFAFASECAEKLSQIDHGLNARSPVAVGKQVTTAKLEHDLEQAHYLTAVGKANAEVLAAVEPIRGALETMHACNGRRPLVEFQDPAFLLAYNRLLQVHPAPRADGGALAESWRQSGLERKYLEGSDRFSVIDGFLTQTSLRGLQKFCLESTIWFENRYDHGRLGAFLRSGFNCPLLFQIAEELRERLPNLINERHELTQVWAFKYSRSQPATAPHADFAAVNVNFWITPDDANTDPEGGGLVIHDVEAPLSWTFEQYNSRGNQTRPYVDQMSKKSTRIPYRCNRAVIFHSDLFHATDAFAFRPGYENRRINITMLFGVREDEQ